jgi:putative inorganic carbon (hco3(-)) transporter
LELYRRESGTVALVVVALVVLLGLTFALGRRSMILLVLLTRAVCDPIFDVLKTGGSDIGLGATLNALVIIVALAFYFDRPREINSNIGLMWLPFLAVGLSSCLFTAPEPTVAFRFFLVQLSYCAMFAIPFSIINSNEDLYDSLIVILLSSIVPTFYGFYELLSGGGMTDSEGLRLRSTFSHPNIFAFYLTLQIATILFLLRSEAVKVAAVLKQIISLYLPVLLVLLALTKTRSAWLACGLIIVIYSVRLDRRYLIYIFGILIAFLLEPSLRDRLTDLESGNVSEDYAKLNSFAWRQLLWKAAMDWIVQNPIRGHGLESFKFYVDQFFPLPLEEGRTFDAHNVYVQILFETGIIGLVSFLWTFVVLLQKSVRGYVQDRAGFALLITFALAYLVVCYSDNMQFYLSFNWYFWFLMGAVCAWAKVPQQAESSIVEAAPIPAEAIGRAQQKAY